MLMTAKGLNEWYGAQSVDVLVSEWNRLEEIAHDNQKAKGGNQVVRKAALRQQDAIQVMLQQRRKGA